MPIAVKPGLAKGVSHRDESPLRGRDVSKLLREPRRAARIESAVVLADACESEGVSQGRLGERFGGELAGCQLLSGALVATAGEVAFLTPLDVASGTLLRLLRLRFNRELTTVSDSMAKLRIEIAITNIDAAMACVRGLGKLLQEPSNAAPCDVRLTG